MKKRLKLRLAKETLQQLDGSILRDSGYVAGRGTLFTCRYDAGEGICVDLDETSMYPTCP